MFCSKCGKEIADESKFCPKCGFKFGTPENIPSSSPITKKSISKKKGCLGCLGIIILVFIFAGVMGTLLGNKNSTNSVQQAQTQKKEDLSILLGGTVESDNMDVTVNKVELTYDVLPDKTGGFYTHYPADSGNVYISVDVNVKNKQKQDLRCDKIMQIDAKYNGDYGYSLHPVVKDSHLGFNYANIVAIKPLETKGLKYMVQVPQEVAESQNPLFLTFTIDGKKYKYTVR